MICLNEVTVLDLLEILRTFDGKAVSILSEARTQFGDNANFLSELAALIGSDEAYVADGATWLIKDCAENGMVIKPKVIAVIIDRLDAVPSWQAALHLCQAADFFVLTPSQARRFGEWAAGFLDHQRPFLRAWSMSALQHTARRTPDLAGLAETALTNAEQDRSASVRARARQVRAAS